MVVIVRFLNTPPGNVSKIMDMSKYNVNKPYFMELSRYSDVFFHNFGFYFSLHQNHARIIFNHSFGRR
jgi:hypothetical protein